MPQSIKLLRSEKYKDFLACTDRSTLNMSDFEKFAFACENFSCMWGSDFINDFLSDLSVDLNMDISHVTLKGRENQKQIWKIIHGYSESALTLEENERRTILNIDRTAPKSINSLLLSQNIPASLDDLTENISESVIIDISDLRYLRPDEYHSAVTYHKIRNGEDCNGDELCALLCWILCRALMKRNLRVYLIADESMSEAEKLLCLLNDRGLFPDIRLCFYPSDGAVDKATEICLNAPQKNISPEIIISEDSDVVENIIKIFRKIPASRIYFCGFMGRKDRIGQLEAALNLMAEEK